MIAVPGLHVVTNDEVLAASWFPARARRLVETAGSAIALHLRGPRTPPSRLLDLAELLAPVATASGTRILINDRADVALAAEADGVHLGQRSLPLSAVRSMRADWMVGVSVHSVEEAASATGADFIVAGTIWPSASHPDREGAGLERLHTLATTTAAPVIAIGGVTPERASTARAAGAAGVAVLTGVWHEADPVGAAEAYVDAMNSGAGVRP